MSLTPKFAHVFVNPTIAPPAPLGAASTASVCAHLKSAQPRSTGELTLKNLKIADASATLISALLATTGTRKFATVSAHHPPAISHAFLAATGTASAADAALFHKTAVVNPTTRSGMPRMVNASALRTPMNSAMETNTSTTSLAAACAHPNLAQTVSIGTLVHVVAFRNTALVLSASTTTLLTRLANACHSFVLQA